MNVATKLHYISRNLSRLNTCSPFQTQLRNSSYFSSKFLEDCGEITTKYEITRNPEEWKYVERLIPPATVPEPTKKANYPSGWKPAADNFETRPYFVNRTKNHMLPVYLKIKNNRITRLTIIRRIQGDIWQLEKDLKPFLADMIKPKPLLLLVDEFAGKITISGDFVNAIKHWLTERSY